MRPRLARHARDGMQAMTSKGPTILVAVMIAAAGSRGQASCAEAQAEANRGGTVSAAGGPCVGSVEDLSLLSGTCRDASDPACAVFHFVFPPCPLPRYTGKLMIWSADGALTPPAEHGWQTPFFFSLKAYDSGEVIADVATTMENINSLYDRYFVGADKKDIANVLSRLHVARASVSSKECPELRGLAKDLETQRILTEPPGGITLHATGVLLVLQGEGKRVTLEDDLIQSGLRDWLQRLRSTVAPFLAKAGGPPAAVSPARPAPRPKGSVVFSSKELGFSVRYPAAWYLLPTTGGELFIISYPPPEPMGPVAEGGAGIFIDYYGKGLYKDGEDWARNGNQPGWKILSKREVPLVRPPADGCTALTEVVSREDLSGGDKPIMLTTTLYCSTVRGPYRISLAYWRGDPKEDEYKAVALSIALSLRLL